MAFTWAWLIALIALIVLAYAQLGGISRASSRKTWTILGIVGIAVGLLAVYGNVAFLAGLNAPLSSGTSNTQSIANTNTGNTLSSIQDCPAIPTASYTARDKFSTTTITGTSYYKAGNLPASTSSPIIQSGNSYVYWVDNNTNYYVMPQSFNGACSGVNVVTLGVANATATVTGYDTVNNAQTSNGLYNTSMGANKQANIRITYQGTAKAGFMPYGGVMAVEFNSTISSVTCTGDDISTANPYHVTYTVTSTNNRYQLYGVTSGLDDGSGTPGTINCQFQNGATAAGAGAAYYFKFIPANYYVTNAGDIVLDVEKFANQDTTRTGKGIVTLTSYWGT